jgi:hypothetical protein
VSAAEVFAHARQQEHFVVGAQPEQDGEQQHWRIAEQGAQRVKFEQRVPNAKLEDEHQQAIARGQ